MKYKYSCSICHKIHEECQGAIHCCAYERQCKHEDIENTFSGSHTGLVSVMECLRCEASCNVSLDFTDATQRLAPLKKWVDVCKKGLKGK